jgi:hypothetical protein
MTFMMPPLRLRAGDSESHRADAPLIVLHAAWPHIAHRTGYLEVIFTF